MFIVLSKQKWINLQYQHQNILFARPKDVAVDATMSRVLIAMWLAFVIISVMVVVINVKNVVLHVDVGMVIVFTRVKNVTIYIVTTVVSNKNKLIIQREIISFFLL